MGNYISLGELQEAFAHHFTSKFDNIPNETQCQQIYNEKQKIIPTEQFYMSTENIRESLQSNKKLWKGTTKFL
jgi:hypothetical protein